MKDKITFKELSDKGKDIRWNCRKNDDGTYTVRLIYDSSKELILASVPGQYVKEDGEIDKKELDEAGSVELVDRRIKSLLMQIQQAIFTFKFYGANITGSISSKKGAKRGK